MSKIYILTKEISLPEGTCPVGTMSVYDDQGYYIFPYTGMDKPEEGKGWLGYGYWFHESQLTIPNIWAKEIDPATAEKMAHFNKIRKANQEGYVGCLPNGNLVDRREHPKAHPVLQNPMFGIAPPRCIGCGNETRIEKLVDSCCA